MLIALLYLKNKLNFCFVKYEEKKNVNNKKKKKKTSEKRSKKNFFDISRHTSNFFFDF